MIPVPVRTMILGLVEMTTHTQWEIYWIYPTMYQITTNGIGIGIILALFLFIFLRITC